MPEDSFVSRFVGTFFESETAALFWLLQSPSGKDLGNFRDIFLCVAAVDAERVQFHQFAAVILVEAIALAFGLLGGWISLVIGAPPVLVGVLGNAIRDIGIRADTEPVVEVEKHRGTLCRSF